MAGNTQTIFTKQQIVFSDFTNNFDKAPFSNDVSKVINENSVKQSIRNIVRTTLGERLYDNTIGTNIQTFELDDTLSSSIFTRAIQDAINFNEKRAKVLQVSVVNNPDQNAYEVTIIFTVVNNPQVQQTTIILQRVR